VLEGLRQTNLVIDIKNISELSQVTFDSTNGLRIGAAATCYVWAVVLTVALYPAYDSLVRLVGGRRRLAAVLITIVNLLIVIGPATWIVLGLVDSLRAVSALAIPPPLESVRNWPVVGERLFEFWELASGNLQAALVRVAPHLKSISGSFLQIAAEGGTGAIKFLVAIVIAGFLFSPAPALATFIRGFSRKLDPEHGEDFVQLAGSTIRAVSRGVVGISALQAFLAGVGLMVAGVPGASLITSAVLILGIIQIGPALVLIPLIIWSWFAMDATAALLFTAYMVPVGLLDNFLRPLVMGRGLDTPVLIILIGVIGGTVSYGISGLFLGPIILAVIWQLLTAWIGETKTP
jgi:predicted PurR-regulated permease PerM